MKSILRLSVAAATSLLVGVATLTPAFAEDITVRFGFAQVGVGNRQFGSGNSAAIAHAQGLVEAEFKDDPGVKIDWSFFKGAGPAVNEALANDQIDFALHGDLPAIVGRSNGLKTKIVAANGLRANIYLAVLPNSGIERIEDLKGRKIAQFRGTNLQLATDKVLAAHGLTERDVRFISMDFATATAALASGDIDGAFGQADYLGLEKQGVARVIYSTKGTTPRLPGIRTSTSPRSSSRRIPRSSPASSRCWSRRRPGHRTRATATRCSRPGPNRASRPRLSAPITKARH